MKRIIKVTELLDPNGCGWRDGLLGEGRLGIEKIEMPLGELDADEEDPKLRPLADDGYWFWNCR